jgi:hypothetical protein
MCLPALERLSAVQCPLPAAAVAQVWQQRPGLLLLTGSGSAALQHLALLQEEQQQQRPQQGPRSRGSSGSSCVREVCPLPPLDDGDGFFAI